MYKNFQIQLIIRILLLVGTIFLFAFIFGNEGLYVNHFIIGAVIVLQVAELIRFVNHTNRELSRLFNAITHSDFSTTFQGGFRSKSFRELEKSMNQIMIAYKTVKIEREAQFQLLQMLINQVNVGIIALENDSEITLINPVTEKLLGVKGIRNWKLLHQLSPEFTNVVAGLGDNGRRLFELTTSDHNRMLSIDVHTANLLDKPHRLITIQDINSEIEQKEIEAWHKLIRILTHEIMNSVTPISSLTETTQMMLADVQGKPKKIDQIHDETIFDILFSLKTIQKRSDGLLNFVESYRKLTRIPKPSLQLVSISDLLISIEKLMHEELVKRRIEVEINWSASLTVTLDRSLIEQVLINLITNSMHALVGRPYPKITLSCYEDGRTLVIEVRDNGKGISSREMNEIFIPFFSTRKDGSGIGLSLSKQIMSLHGGSIKVKSKEGEGTSFYLNFRGVN